MLIAMNFKVLGIHAKSCTTSFNSSIVLKTNFALIQFSSISCPETSKTNPLWQLVTVLEDKYQFSRSYPII